MTWKINTEAATVRHLFPALGHGACGCWHEVAVSTGVLVQTEPAAGTFRPISKFLSREARGLESQSLENQSKYLTDLPCFQTPAEMEV